MKYLSPRFVQNLIYWGTWFIWHLHCCMENTTKTTRICKSLSVRKRDSERTASTFHQGTLCSLASCARNLIARLVFGSLRQQHPQIPEHRCSSSVSRIGYQGLGIKGELSRAGAVHQLKCHGDVQIIDARGQSSARMENPDEGKKIVHCSMITWNWQRRRFSRNHCLFALSAGEHGDRYIGV